MYTLVVIIVGILAFAGCEKKKKETPIWALGLMGSSSATGTGTDTGTGSGTGTGTGTGSGSGSVETPTFSPAAGHYNTAQNITITTTTSGANVYYTTNGSNPTTSSTTYSTAVHIWSLAGKTIKAFATKSGLTDSSVLSGIFSYPPLKSGQTTVYAAGDNGTNQSGVVRGYTDNGNGTVTDTATGLIWQKCSRGQNADATCTGTATTATWADAGTYCTGLSLASKTWRLPTRQELETLPDYSKSNPAIDTAAFPATAALNYWSSTTYAPSATDAWDVNFSNGFVGSDSKTGFYYVRCVSGL